MSQKPVDTLISQERPYYWLRRYNPYNLSSLEERERTPLRKRERALKKKRITELKRKKRSGFLIQIDTIVCGGMESKGTLW